MRKTILIAEYLRLSELIEVNDRQCPVCKTSDKLRQRYEGYHCSNDILTACHPTIQKRCKTIIDTQTEFNIQLESTRYDVLKQLIWDYNMSKAELQELFINWIKERNQL